MPKAKTDEVAELRTLLQKFVRDWGLLDQDGTPCGQPLQPSHAHALMFLLEHASATLAPTQKDLASALGIDKSNATRLCQRMETLEHVVQVRSSEDARARYLRLTPKGLKAAREVDRASRARFARLYEDVAPDRRQQLLAGVRILAASVAMLRDE